MTVPHSLTVTFVHDPQAPVSVEFLANMARDLGWPCFCRGRGEVEGYGGVLVGCPVCSTTGLAA